MARTPIDTGSSANSNTGDPLRTAFIATEDNFIELYNKFDNVPTFPFTSSTDNPAQITGSNGSLAVLGITGSVEASKAITSSFLQLSDSITFKDDPTTKITFASGKIEFFVAGTRHLSLDGANSRVVVNLDEEDINFIVNGDSNDNLLFCDAGLDRVGILTNTPRADFHVNGNISASQYFGNIPEGQTQQTFTSGQFYYTSSEHFTGGSGPFFNIIMVED